MQRLLLSLGFVILSCSPPDEAAQTTKSQGKYISPTKGLTLDCAKKLWASKEAFPEKASRLLRLIDKDEPQEFDCDKPIAIFVHGWIVGERTPFLHARKWREKGYNTLVFEWYAVGGDPFAIFSKPGKFSRQAEDDLATALRNIKYKMGANHSPDIHLIGHSFGAKVATGASALAGCSRIELFQRKATEQESEPESAPTNNSDALVMGEKIGVSEDTFGIKTGGLAGCPRITRLTMLDPALLIDYAQPHTIGCNTIVDNSSDDNFAKPDMGALLNNPNHQSSNIQEEASRILAAVLAVKSKGIKIENYAANVANFNSSKLSSLVPTSIVTKRSILPCRISMDGLSITDVHSYLVDRYLASITDTEEPQLVDEDGKPLPPESGTAISPRTQLTALRESGIVYQISDEQDEKKSSLGSMLFKLINVKDMRFILDMNACPQGVWVPSGERCDRTAIKIEVDI